MISGGQCVMTCGTTLMLLWCASSWDMHTLEVSLYKALLCMLTTTVNDADIVCELYMYSCKSIQQCLLWYWEWTNRPG